MRITDKMIEARVAYLNKITGSPAEPYSRNADGKMVANIGNFHVSHAYGGVCIHRMHNERGGVSTPIIAYHAPKRECFEKLCSFIDGIEFVKGA